MSNPIHHPPGAFRQQAWSIKRVSGSVQSSFTLRRQVFIWPGETLTCMLDLPPMPLEKGQAWEAFFDDLGHGSFWLSPSTFLQSNALLGDPSTVGASSGGSLATKGWLPFSVIKAGLWISIAGRLRRVVRSVSASSSGDAIIHLEPKLGAVKDGTPVVWKNPRGRFVLAEDPPSLVWRVDKFLDEFGFAVTEEDYEA